MMMSKNVEQTNSLTKELYNSFDEVQCGWTTDKEDDITGSYITVRKHNKVHNFGFEGNIYLYDAKATAHYIVDAIKDNKAKSRTISKYELFMEQLLAEHEIQCVFIRLEDGMLCDAEYGYEIELESLKEFHVLNDTVTMITDEDEEFILDLKEDTLIFEDDEFDFGDLSMYKLYTDPQTMREIRADVINSKEIPSESKIEYLEQFIGYDEELKAAWAIGIIDSFVGFIIIDKDNNVVDRISY